MEKTIVRTRIGGSKVRTGCRTCKRRRVKCDEARPICGKCLKGGHVCEGYASPDRPAQPIMGRRYVHYIDPKSVLVTTNPNPHVELNDSALRSLEFFHYCTAPWLEQPFSSETWLRGLSCCMHSEPTVKHGLITLAALHENHRFPAKTISAEQRRILALEHYGKSIRSLVQLNVEDAGKAIGLNVLTSLLYCAIESIQGHFSSAIRHLTAAVRLLSEHNDFEPGFNNFPEGLLSTLRRVFFDLATQAIALGDSKLPQLMPQYLKQSRVVISGNFSTIEQAWAELTSLLNELMSLMMQTWTVPEMSRIDAPGLRTTYQNLSQRYIDWTKAYARLQVECSVTQPARGHPSYTALLILRANHTMARIALGSILETNESRFDRFTADFEAIVSTAEELHQVELKPGSSYPDTHQRVFSMNLGIVPALFFSCIRCRHRAIRWRALSMLKTCGRREMVWDGAIAGMVAEQLILVEEKAAMIHQRGTEATTLSRESCAEMDFQEYPEGLPSSMRIRSTDIQLDQSENRAVVSLIDIIGLVQHSQVLAWTE